MKSMSKGCLVLFVAVALGLTCAVGVLAILGKLV